MQIVATKRFGKRLRKQPVKIKKEFKKRIRLFTSDMFHPLLNTHKLSGKAKNMWSFNISGDIRVVFDANQKGVVILVDIGSHSELYS